MRINGSFGEQAVAEKDLLPWLNRIALPILRKMLAAQNDCDCGGGGSETFFSLTEPTDGEDGDVWVETA